MRTLTIALLSVLVAATAFADQPSRESETQSLYVLRAYVFPGSPNAYQGIFRYDPVAKTYASFAPFDYNARFGALGATRLGAAADRIIVQSSGYYEFELATGRLLRRYDSSDATQDGFAFHGVVVTEEQAKALGIASGTYGFPLCIYYVLSDPISSTCTPRQFPGYSAPTLTPASVLLRRSLDPADPTLTVVKSIGSQSASFFLNPAVTLDAAHRQFWMWGAAGGQWATLAINGGTVGDPNPATLGTPSTFTYMVSLTFHEPSETLFDVVEQPDLRRQFLKQPTSNATAASIVESVAPSDLSQPRVDSVTAIPGALPERYVQMIPAIGELHGLNGTFWRSDVWLYNPADTDVDVTIRRVVRPESASTQHLAAHGSVVLRNVLSTLGGGSAGDGVTLDALVIDAPYHRGAQLSAYSRTFTDASDGGTFGQAIPGVPSTVGYSTHPIPNASNPYILNGTGGPGSSFVIDQRQPGRFRHNLGVVNDSATPLGVTLSFGTKKSVSVAPHSVTTINIESLFPGDVSPLVFVEADRAAPVWMSIVDNISEDATFVPFELFPLSSDSSTEMAIPAIAATAGGNGTSWRTDLFGILPRVAPGGATLATTHFDSASGCTADAVLSADGLDVYSDVARQFGPCGTSGSGLGALRLAGTTWMAGYSRTYTTRADGGTFGDMLPFYPTGGWPLQHFSGIETGSRFRINVGLYNGQSTTTTNRLFLYDANGTLVAQRDIDLASHASLQAPIASLMNIANLPAGLYGLSVIPAGAGHSWAYVSLVDSITGDPTNLW
ncbi:MAG TPA: hypothetical protein VF713_09950 [Thermoanaerobaculia bacterium]